MFCRKCGTEISPDCAFCPRCGERTTVVDESSKRNPASQINEYEKAETIVTPVVNNEPAAKTDAQPIQPQPVYTQPIDTPPVQTQQTYTQPAHKETKNKKLFWGILSAGFLLCIILAVVITVNVVNHSSSTSSQNGTATTQETNTSGNTPSNILCEGIAAKQGNTIYYMQVDPSSDDDILMSMGLDGKNKQELYSFEGDIYGINVIGKQVFFVGDIFDDNNNCTDSGIYVYDLNDETTTNLFHYSDSVLYSLYVTTDQLYFRQSNKEDTDKIISANLDGSNKQTIFEEDDYIYSLSIFDSSFYYEYQNTLYRRDLDGQNATSLYDTSSLSAYSIENDKLYIADNKTMNGAVILSMNLNGENETTLGIFDTNESLLYLNAVDDTIYYAVDTVDEKGNVTGCEICSMNNDGTNKQTLVTTENEIYGLAIFDHWLFYYNNDDYETVIVDLNDL